MSTKRGQPLRQLTKTCLRRHHIFEDDLEKERYEEIHKQPIILGKSNHNPTLDTLKIRIGVIKLIYAIGWENLFVMDVLAYMELVREFYTTF